MAYLQLQPHVSYGLVQDRPVFLDLRRDRYFALAPEAEQAFRELCAAPEPTLAPGAGRTSLLASGLLRESSLRGRLAQVVAAQPCGSLLDEPPGRFGWIVPVRVWRTVRRARRRLAATPLYDILDALREARLAGRPRGHPGEAEQLAREFLAARALVPIERNCLLDCVALLDWLADTAGHATFVFGVRLDPFGAHCWLQTDQRLLTDANDLAGNFTPVFAL